MPTVSLKKKTKKKTTEIYTKLFQVCGMFTCVQKHPDTHLMAEEQSRANSTVVGYAYKSF